MSDDGVNAGSQRSSSSNNSSSSSSSSSSMSARSNRRSTMMKRLGLLWMGIMMAATTTLWTHFRFLTPNTTSSYLPVMESEEAEVPQHNILQTCFPHPQETTVDLEQLWNESDSFMHGRNRSLFHLHIQKSGGTAMSVAMANSLCDCPPEHNRTFKSAECQCRGIRARNGQKISILHSRLTTGWARRGCGVHPWLPRIRNCDKFQNLTVGGIEDDVAIITFLRDPLTRVISEYKHCGKGGNCWGVRFKKKTSLQSFAECDIGYPHHNRQMKMASNCPKNLNWTDDAVNRKCLELAKANIAHGFGFVGLHEALPFFAHMLGKFLNRTVALPNKNVHHKEQGFARTDLKHSVESKKTQVLLTPNIRSTIVHNNRYDYELYNFARDFLCRKYSVAGQR